MIAYFGTGVLGANFIRRMLERGETVHVWNRTAEKARALEADGAKAFDNPADAVRGASEIHLTLSDDDAVDSVLEPLADIVLPTAIIVDHTTTAPTLTGERARRWTARGRYFVHAPVFMGPKNAREGTGVMLLSGDPKLRALVRPRLEPMTGKIIELGDDPSRAAAFKLFGNMILVTITSGLADVYHFSRALGIEPAEVFKLFEEWNPGGAVLTRGRTMAQGADGSSGVYFELSMARKDVRLMLEEAARHGEKLDIVPAVAALFDRYIDAGYGKNDVGVVGSDLRTASVR